MILGSAEIHWLFKNKNYSYRYLQSQSAYMSFYGCTPINITKEAKNIFKPPRHFTRLKRVPTKMAICLFKI